MLFLRKSAGQSSRRLVVFFILVFILALFPAQVAQANLPNPADGEPLERQVGSSAPAESVEQGGCSAVLVNPQNAAAEQWMVELVNQKRAENGLPPLKRSVELDNSARAHSKDVHDDRYFYHDTYDRVDGSLRKVCSWSARISLYYSGTPEGENVAGGYDPAEKVLQAWMGSAGHRVNILNKKFREIGVGHFSGPNAYKTYWTQDFGTRPDVFPVVINGEAARTGSPQVSLYIYREDDSWDEMRLRNDAGAWSEWQPFAAEVAWTLDSLPGERAVTVQVRRDGSVRQVSDTILLASTSGSLPAGAASSQAALGLPGQSAGAPAAGVVASTGAEEPPPTPQEAPPPDDPMPDIGEPASVQPDPIALPDEQPLFTGCSRVNVAVQNAAYEQQVVELVNQKRAENGQPPLKRYGELDFAARYHSKDQHDDNYVKHDTHDRSGGQLVFVCDTWQRFANYYPSTGARGENIAAGYSTPSDVMQGWIESAGHLANILNSNYREIGVGYFNGSNGYRSYWVQNFGSRSGVYPVVINREAASTAVPQVNLYIYRESSAWNEMRIRNDNGTWTAWMPFNNNLAWTLDWVQGARTVNVEVRNGGSVRAVSDTIQLTTSANSLGNLPDSLTFVYDQAAGQHYPSSAALNPRNIGNSAVLGWTASESAGWLSLTPGSGSTPSGSFTVTPNGSSLSPGKYTTTLTVTVTSPASPPTLGSPKQITITLSVVDTLDNRMYLPSIYK